EVHGQEAGRGGGSTVTESTTFSAFGLPNPIGLSAIRMRWGSRLVSISSPKLSSRRRSGCHRSGFNCRIAIAERRSDDFVHHRPVVLIPVEWLSLYLSVGEGLQTRRQGHFISFDDETAAVFHSALN